MPGQFSSFPNITTILTSSSLFGVQCFQPFLHLVSYTFLFVNSSFNFIFRRNVVSNLHITLTPILYVTRPHKLTDSMMMMMLMIMKMMIDIDDDEDDYCASHQGQGCRDKLHAKEVARENFSKLRKLLAWGEAVITTFQVSITELKHKYSLHFQAKIMT